VNVTVTNLGPSDASNVSVTITVDPSLTIQTVSSGCTPSGNVVTCSVASLAASASHVFTITVVPTSPGSQQIDASASADEYDPDSGNNSATFLLGVDPAADLSVVKSASPDPVAVNCNLTYTIVVTNNGPDAATSVTLVDQLPSGVAFISASTGCNELSGVVTCDLGTLGVNDTTTVTIIVQPTSQGSIQNNVSVSAAEADPSLGNNVADAAVSVEPDCNANCIPDAQDIANQTSNDCNGNGIPDECDIANQTSQDCNTNGVPDECETDCNGNGVPDDCDIANQTSSDCNSNQIPDECDLTSGTSQDCNGNQIPDECDIASQTSQDCNANGVPDECETDCNTNGIPDDCDIANQTSQDCNSNNVPDECDLTSGTSQDCNGNQVPDECDLANQTSQDCNQNGIPDECDVVPQVGALVWSEDFENGLSQWAASGLWRLEVGAGCLSDNATLSPVTQAAYNDMSRCDYNVGTTMGSLELTTDVQVPASGGVLRWYNWVETEDYWPYDEWRVEVSSDGGANWSVVYDSFGASRPYWQDLWADLSAYAGQSIRVRFVFDSVDDYANYFHGWYVDDIRLYQLVPATSADCNANAVPDECETDCNGNGVPDDCDLTSGTSQDCNQNGVPDECDIANQTSQDCNTNGVPDECEADCNGNGVPDDCDLTSGTSQDCNGNQIPDECDIASQTSQDCNGNGVPDECDLTSGTSQDCNQNGVPDECDIADQTSQDCNANGVPDECETDCNTNGIPDDCDIANATSQDCNANGVPDECDLTAGTSQDCNTNQIPDECDIANQTSQDCNANGVPDECDISSQTSSDCNNNGVPDECETDCNANGVPDDCDLNFGFGVPFYESFENGLTTWTASGLWRLESGVGCLPLDGTLTPDTQAAYNDEIACNYDVGPTSGALAMTTDIVLPPFSYLIWYSWAEIDGQTDELRVEISTDGGASWSVVWASNASITPWDFELVDLFAYAGQSVRLRFVFDSVDGNNNGLLGWYVDDIYILNLVPPTSFDCNSNNVPDECDIANQTSQDCNQNQIPDECEPDCNTNGVPDDCDVTSGTSQDCNQNSIPDECEPDCNVNGVADDCDLTSGTSQDCNANQIPDECDIANQTSSDCNANGVPDECDLTAGTSQDCNQNGVPDECDIASQTSQDCNGNGVPDECDLTSGTSQDCNANQVPDECDLANQTSQDCNQNGIPDECDLAPQVGALVWSEDFENGLSLWTTSGLWRLEVGVGCLADDGTLSPATQAAYNDEGQCNYDVGATMGSLELTTDVLVPVSGGLLRWYNWVETENNSSWDRWRVEVSADGGANWSVVYDGQGARRPYWQDLWADVSAYAGQSIRVRFVFDSVDSYYNGYLGWYVDDVRLYEWVPSSVSSDCNGNAVPDECETDCNGNGVPDDCDLTAGTSQDCNANQIPDECDIANQTSQDCNANGVPDECDLASGTSQDCNQNGVPDECDIANQTSQDCNSNNVPDECDLASGTSQDCNANGVPDECETDCNGNSVPDDCDIADQTSEDCNSNGVPDECDLQPQLGALVWSEDFENGLGQWTTSGLWHLEVGDGCLFANGTLTPPTQAAYNDEFDCDYGVDNFGALELRTDVLVPVSGGVLRWYNWVETEEDYDDWWVEVSADGGATWVVVYDGHTQSYPYWEQLQVDLSAYAGQSIRMRFVFNADESISFLGWYIDDIRLYERLSPTSQDCNGNLIPDECDIADQTSEDCNSNGVPDECDLQPQLGALVWSEDFENGLGQWTTSGLWHLEVGDGCLFANGTLTPPTQAAYNDEFDCDYGVDNFGALELRTDVLVPVSGGVLRWYNWVETEEGFDNWWVEVSADGGATWDVVYDGQTQSYPYWQQLQVDLSAYAGQAIRIRFVFEADVSVSYLGWYIDDIRLYERLSPASQDCNGNQIPDECDIANQTSQDCNSNGVPDECDLQPRPGPIVWSEDFENGLGQWTTSGLWHHEVGDGCLLANNTLTPATQAAYNDEFDCNYGGDNSGALELTTDVLVPASGGVLRWYNWVQTEEGYDNWRVELSADGGATWDLVYDGQTQSYPYWQELQVDLSAYAGQAIRIRFVFVADFSISYLGWYIDDVRLYELVPASSDCNANGVPDECDLTSGTSQDCNQNGVPDECDIANQTSQDCNQNGVPDECDIADQTSSDCNQNGVPDECETDCNGNGVPDDCDLTSGTSQDCNTNGVPDECDIANQTSQDCNANGLPDECETDCNGNQIPDDCDIANATSQDCNGNGVPDECDLTSGTSQDCNQNGVPDDCDIASQTSQDCNQNGVPDECDFEPQVGALVWSEDFENGLSLWTTSGLWRLEVGAGCLADDGTLSPVTQAAYNDESQCNYDVGTTTGALELATDVLVPVSGGVLRWYNWVETEDFSPYDDWRVEVSSDGGASWSVVYDAQGTSRPYWQDLWADVSAYAGQLIRVRFVFDSVDEVANDTLGWYVDDVRLYELVASPVSKDCNANAVPDECEADCNGNGVPDDCDLTSGTSQDCNENGIPDECDVASQSSSDCNANGVPDECEPDCNENGVPDDCDLTSGTSQDCNQNGVPDECDIANQTSPDCNTNGVPDECETDCNGNGVPDDCDLTSGMSQDCNQNGVPDECDIANQTSPDCNQNQIPDECETDCNGNGVPDDCDLTSGTSQDCNQNGVPDECDIANQTSEDCNANQIPDECETDCNANGVPDDCDLTSGTSQDCNQNGVPDECDIANQTSQDCNQNGVPDECDIADQTSSDCNQNGVPDECETDCNGNGVPDDCDLTSGTSQDCNQNGIPDECDIANQTSQDCNTNGVPDECETDCNGNQIPDDCDIANATSQDCNANGVPDECDLTSGTSEDCNQNGMPDECDIANQTSQDCNQNGVPDECDLEPQVGALVWSEDFENGLDQWTTSGLWRLEVGVGCLADDGTLSPVTQAAYNNDSLCNYDVGTTTGALELATDVLVPVSGGVLRWYNWVETEDFSPYDDWRVEVSSDGGASWSVVYDGQGASRPYWQDLWADLSAYAGQSIRVRFVFDSVDEVANDTLGWYVDDVRLYELVASPVSVDCNANGVPDECEADCNGNGVPDDCDLTSGTSQDCNENGIPDECDVASQSSSDCNANGVPDECEPDCNENGVPDDCDLTSGTSQDCNQNGVPDECDIVNQTSSDCNANGVPDECETDCNGNQIPDDCDIANQTSPDCNGNGVPDECDLTSGTSQDCNANGIPDECDIENQTSADCNGNGMPDECEPDCNGNGTPDDCDIDGATSSDCNADGIPDDCQLTDIEITKTIVPAVGVVDEPVTFTVTVINHASWNAPVDAYELVPPSFIVQSASVSMGTLTDLGGGLYYWSLTLGALESAQLEIVALPTESGEFVNQASANSCLPDGTENNFVQQTVFVGLDCNSNGIEDTFETNPTEGALLLAEDFENGAPAWQTSGLWHLETADPCGVGADTLTSPTRAAYNVGAPDCNYDVGVTSGALELTTDVLLPSPYGAVLKWYNYVETEDAYPFDQWVVQVSTDGGATWETVFDPRGASRPMWEELSVNLEKFAGQAVRIRFAFDSFDGEFNNFLGWYVDDVRLVALGAPVGADCNWNGIPDECDITSGTSLDCNANGAPDECEIGQAVRLESELQAPFDGETPQTISFAAAPSVGPVTLLIEGVGNFGDHLLETFDIYINGTYFATKFFANGGQDCTLGNASVVIPANVFNAAVLAGGGVVSFTFAPSAAVDPLCEGSFVKATLRYLVDSPLLDCNQNGVPDDCDIANQTSQDCNGNGVPDECDLASQSSQDCNQNGIPDECETDCNGNGVPDDCDLTSGTSQDCNGNQIPDECDITNQTSLDCNGNGVPDECETDCNANGIPDECDITNQTSLDCNGNGVPDECDIANQTSQDCNQNGIPDECDLATGTSQDCNQNGIPDECDIATGTSQDCNGNQIPDDCDLTSGTSQDCNQNGIPDECDIANQTSQDCNTNGVPDECETDCNANGIPDECDITNQTSLDCNGNGVPDECDLATGTSQDCNQNGIPDECDIATGTSQDCNGNQIPDDCDLTSGTSQDCNQNGVPDECDITTQTSQDCNANGVPDECETDCNGNGVADDCDLTSGTSQDCNGNQIPDECDIESQTSSDCNANGVPDECDSDCNANQIPDDCDIESQTSQDCNGNGVPDECDLTSGTSEDCNQNSVPDECDIANQTSQDCNANQIPDECDIANQTSSDCNSNGVPDDCDIASQTSQDCNQNGVPDECDLEPQVSALVWSEDFENGLSQWTASGLWRLEVGEGCLKEDGTLSPVTQAAYNDEGECNYDVGTTMGSLELTTDVLVPASGGVLRWYNWVETENDSDFDHWRVEVSSDGGANWSVVYNGQGASRPYWQDLWADVSAYAGQSIRVRFVFDSVDSIYNGYLGWYVDDVRLYELVASAVSSDCNGNAVPDECEADCNANGVPDDCDLTSGTSQDCNENGIPDECDIASQTSSDCNANGVPDECETDCNENGVPDDCDLTSGTSQDCNQNGIPDECDIANQTSQDCNTNGVPDECETDCNGNQVPDDCDLTSGTSQDCNANGIPDECDIASQTSQDCNGNGVPDECDLTSGTSEDCNQNSVPDECDIANQTSQDCNANQIPDECDIANQTSSDCNSNGVPDDCDIASQTSQDCNQNGIPDECDLATGTSQDCNQNGIPDECDIANETSQDCNGNGVPDECDLAEANSQDCNQNGVPDECETDCNANGTPDDCDIAGGTSRDCNTNGIPDECDIASQTSEDCNSNGVPDECEPDCNGNGVADECDIAEANSQDCNQNGVPDECETDCNANGTPDDCDIADGTSQDGNSDGVPDECQSTNLEIVKTAEMAPAQAGYAIIYTLTVTNLGSVGAPGTVVTDVLPAGMSFLEASSSQGTVAYVAPTVTANLGLMASGTSATVTIKALVLAPGLYTNTASVASSITDPVMANNSSTVFNDVCPGFSPGVSDTFDPPAADSNWMPFAMSVPGFADQGYDATNTAILARVFADPNRYRVAGNVTVPGLWLPYAAVGTDHYVRGKFYVYASPHAVDWTTTGAMPNVRMRLSHRFAQNAMLEVFNHLNVDPAATAVATDIRPSTDPTRPSLYRVDFDPVDTPYLIESGTTEGLWTAFEAYSIDPQDEGFVALAEVVVGVYPKSLLPDTVPPAKVYAPSAGTAGDLAVVQPTDLQMWNYIDLAYYGLGEMPDEDTDPNTPGPSYLEGPQGVTLSSVGVPPNRLAIIAREFYPGALTDRLRVEPNKIYKIRFHVVSDRPSWLQSQMRGRARSVRFMWSQKMEVGGAFNAGSESNADAQQALPGIGCLNPDRNPGDTNGGWYTLIVHSPLNLDIRPEYDTTDPIEARMPQLSAQPGPGVNAESLRDLRVGFDLLDTLSGSSLRGWEEGEFTLDRIEIRVYDEFEDGPCQTIPTLQVK
jgi:uncharacterized repeat protein (TIGR01451 family)